MASRRWRGAPLAVRNLAGDRGLLAHAARAPLRRDHRHPGALAFGVDRAPCARSPPWLRPRSIRERLASRVLRRAARGRARAARDRAQPHAHRPCARLRARGRDRFRPCARRARQRRGRSTGVLFHGAARPEKEWPPDRWIELARELCARGVPLVAPWGTPAEKRAQRSHRRGGARACGCRSACRSTRWRGSLRARRSRLGSTPGSCILRRRLACRWSRSSSAASRT